MAESPARPGERQDSLVHRDRSNQTTLPAKNNGLAKRYVRTKDSRREYRSRQMANICLIRIGAEVEKEIDYISPLNFGILLNKFKRISQK